MNANTLSKLTYENQDILKPQTALDEIRRHFMNKCGIYDTRAIYDETFQQCDLFKHSVSFPIKGVLEKNKKKTYGQKVYCKLIDNQTGANLEIIIDKNLHDNLNDNTECIFNGYFLCSDMGTKSEIKLKFNVTEFIDTKEFYSKDMAIVGGLLTSNFRKKVIDIERLIFSIIYERTNAHSLPIINIGLIVPTTNAITKDIEAGLDEFSRTREYIKIKYHEVNILSLNEILCKLKDIDNMNYDIIGIARGGGPDSELSLFNQSKLCQSIIDLKTPFVTGIAHTGNNFCCESFSSQNYKVPLDLGLDLSKIVSKYTKQTRFIEEKRETEINLSILKTEVNESKKSNANQFDKEFEQFRNELQENYEHDIALIKHEKDKEIALEQNKNNELILTKDENMKTINYLT